MLNNNKSKIDYIFSIEILRFFASLSVVLYHYEYFFFRTNRFQDLNYSKLEDIYELLPLKDLIKPFYQYGDYGVQIFWCISGFIISFHYLKKIKLISFKKFFLNRFSRLYPLHFLTLIILVLITFFYQFSLNETLNKNNDLYHFVLNFFFISSWGFEKGVSFNLPIWSVSKEIVAYLLFYLFATKTNIFSSIKYLITLVIVLIFFKKFFIESSDQNIDLLSCLILFLIGSIIVSLFLSQKKLIIFLFSIILLVLSFIGNFKIFFFCPGLITFIISFEFFLKKFNKLLFFLGNLTYSIYLTHYPLSLLIIYLLKDSTYLFETIYFLISYIILLLILSSIIYLFFEKKLKEYLRNKLIFK